MKTARIAPQIARTAATVYTIPSPRRRRRVVVWAWRQGIAEVLFFLVVLLLVLLLTPGCGTTCARLTEKAAAKGCPDRVITETVEVYEPIDLGDIPAAPPLTSAEITDEEAMADPLVVHRAVAQDLAAARKWGWELWHKLQVLAEESKKRTEGPP